MTSILQALKSRTVLLAIAQSVVGIVLVVLTEADMAGAAFLIKSVADILLRADTTTPLSEK
tara:strand:- start:1541 stop:1723 length:183 start_codon:yes stop_codon:yes gene_type:complete